MRNINIVPRGRYILVKQDDEESRVSEFGIVTPQNIDKERPATGFVLAVGSEVSDIKVGIKVVFGAFAGERLKRQESDKEVDYLLLLEEDVFAFIEDVLQEEGNENETT